jgi:hypothetical protein
VARQKHLFAGIKNIAINAVKNMHARLAKNPAQCCTRANPENDRRNSELQDSVEAE